eukprot:TRINITY_DN66979_c2_g2_i1.p1 TRINITY_DN66979_c2_g2~~TRINITY_DN66979_c2_g2_i1.p1  ORF type:complete len:346 (-),score=197.76 TRINITY_DN66979_c2_g2_i1:75-1013(-)
MSRTCALALRINGTKLGEDVGVRIASLLAQSLSPIGRVSISDAALGYNGVAEIVRALVGMPGLRRIDLDRNVLTKDFPNGDHNTSHAAASGSATAAAAMNTAAATAAAAAAAAASASGGSGAGRLRRQDMSSVIFLDEELGELLMYTPSLEHLSLAGDPSSGKSNPVVRMLRTLYQQMSVAAELREQNQHYDGIGHNSAANQNVPPELSLKYLDVSGNNLQGKGLSALNKALEHLPRLRELRFDDNGVGVMELQTLTRAIVKHTSLVRVPFPEHDAKKHASDMTAAGAAAALGKCRADIINATQRNLSHSYR